MQNILRFKVGFTLSSFQKEFSLEEKEEGINKELDVSLLGNTPKGKYKIHQRCVVLYHGYYILVKYSTLIKPAGRSSVTQGSFDFCTFQIEACYPNGQES